MLFFSTRQIDQLAVLTLKFSVVHILIKIKKWPILNTWLLINLILHIIYLTLNFVKSLYQPTVFLPILILFRSVFLNMTNYDPGSNQHNSARPPAS